jgi:outer membrane receptor protein involved in Fe transport
MQKLGLTLIMLVFMLSLFSQRPGGRPDGVEMPANGIITGKIIEYQTNNPMGYANVALFSLRDSTVFTGAITNMDGSFKVEQVRFGQYYLVANFMGFKRDTVHDIQINPKNLAIDVGTIELHSATENLEAVEIVAQKELIEYQIDKKVINVSQDIMAEGGSAITALENTPSVQVDIDGNVSLRGSSSFTVLVDGRPSILDGSDALQQIPASNIETIEIITNPSAKYDPDGVAGIINVVLKEKIEKGFNGVVNASVSSDKSVRTDFLVNYRYNKFNFFVGADYNDRNRNGSRRSINETYTEDTTFFRNSFGDRDRGRVGYGVRGGFDYYLSDMTTLGVQARTGYYEFNGGRTSYLETFSNPAFSNEYTFSETESKRSGSYNNATVTFQQKFDDFGHQIDALAFYSTRDGEDYDEQQEYLTDENWIKLDDEPYFIRTTEIATDEEFRFKIDYAKPVGEEGKFEAGAQARIEEETEIYTFNEWNYSSEPQDWIEDTLFSNDMDFRRDIYSVYGTYSNTWNSIGYQLGLRSEYTYREIKNKKAEEPSLIDRWDYFPTIHVSKSFDNKDQLMGSYTRRIDRPRGWYLDPFITYIDQFNFRQGNPNLEPEYTDSYEVSYIKRIPASMISVEGYYRVTNNKITRIRTLQEDGSFLHTFQNINNDYSIGAELMVRTDPTAWLNVTVSGNLYHYRIDGSIEDQDIDTESLNWNSRLNAVFKLPKDLQIQISGNYNGPTVTAQGEREGYLMTNAAIKKDFFQKHLSLTASVRDIFSSAKWEFTSSGQSFYTYDYFDSEAPIFNLAVSWKINNYKRQSEGNGNGGGMDMDMDF